MRHSIAWIFLHSFALILVIVSLLTGLRFALLNKPWLAWIPSWLPQGELHFLHALSGFAITAIVIFYIAYRFTSIDEYQKVRSKIDFHRFIIRTGYGAVLATLLTGWLHYLELFAWASLGFIHFVFAISMLCYLVVHGGGYIIHYGAPALKRILLPEPKLSFQNLVILTCCSIALITIITLLSQPQSLRYNRLEVASIGLDEFITVDGIGNEAIWQQAVPLTLMTHGGANFNNGSSQVTIKAMENGEDVYLLITWDDPTRSLQHLPLVKTEQGWSVIEKGYYRFDEQLYYEDKFAVMLSTNCQMAGAQSAHLGPKPLANKPANWHGKGYHYTTDGSIRDIWHWKAVRTNDMYQADDNYFSSPDIIRGGQRRYNAGYYQDGKESGSYVMNWLWYSNQGITPKRLPKRTRDLEPYQQSINFQSKNDGLNWVAPWFEYEPYKKANDTYEVGTVMPSVFYSSNQFEGDRADVKARGVWQQGQWTLELARKVATGSEYDVPFDEGNCLWVAAFDHSQIAHTRHNHPIKLVMQEND